MKRFSAMLFALSVMLGACLPQGTTTPTPISAEELQATAAVLSQQTLRAIPSNTPLPSETPVVLTPTQTPVSEIPTETPNPILLTLTATLGTGTVAPETGTGGIASSDMTATAGLAFVPGSTEPTTTPHPQFYGTLPPHLPYGYITLVNKAEAEVYISLRCVTGSGQVTILEYPVKKRVEATAPSGKYTYVAWVGGRQFTGAFSLSQDGARTIDIYKDKITIK
jgi:hypothetical protein